MKVESKDAPKIEFPCDDYLIKVVGEDYADLRSFVAGALVKYDKNVSESKFTENASKKGRFVSLTVKLRIEKIEDLTSLTADLKANKRVKMVL